MTCIIVPVAATWASEGYFPGKDKKFFQKVPKVVNFDFTHSKQRNQPFSLNME